jgi:uncharacterized protein YjdB
MLSGASSFIQKISLGRFARVGVLAVSVALGLSWFSCNGYQDNSSTSDIVGSPGAGAVTGIEISKSYATVDVGKTIGLTAKVLPNPTGQVVKWKTNAPEVATVSDSGVVSGVSVGTAVIGAYTANEVFYAPCTVAVLTSTDISVTGVSVSPTTVSLQRNGTYQLAAQVVPSNATNKSVSWHSNNTNVATVSATGLVTGVNDGIAHVVVTTADGGFISHCVVTVETAVGPIPVTGVSVVPPTLSINKGATGQLTANVLPVNATNKNVIWQSSNSGIATVNNNGLVSGVSVGNAIVTVITVDGSYSATSQVNVTDPGSGGGGVAVTGVSLDQTMVQLSKNGSKNLVATVSPANATNKALTWFSGNTSVATVDSSGHVTGVADGATAVTVRTVDGNFSAVCVVAVSGGSSGGSDGGSVAVTGVTVNPSTANIKVGGTASLVAIVSPSNATNKGLNWHSGNTNVATVNSSGVVTGVGKGSAVVTVTTADKGFTAASIVTVSDSEGSVAVTGVSLDVSSAVIDKGTTKQLSPVFTPANATNKNVVWRSLNESVATVNSSGVVRGEEEGFATIVVSTVDGFFMAQCNVTVEIMPTGIGLNKNYDSLAKGQRNTLQANVEPSNATNKAVTFVSTNPEIIRLEPISNVPVAPGIVSSDFVVPGGSVFSSQDVSSSISIVAGALGTAHVDAIPVGNGTLNARFTAHVIQVGTSLSKENGNRYRASFFANGVLYQAGDYDDSSTGKSVASLWQNNEKTMLTDGQTNAEGHGITVIERDVYVVGFCENASRTKVARIWLGSDHLVSLDLSSGADLAEAHDISVYGDLLFVVGSEEIFGKTTQTLWIVSKNLKLIRTVRFGQGGFNACFIDNGVLYLTGWQQQGSSRHAAVWKVPVTVGLGEIGSAVEPILINGSHPYDSEGLGIYVEDGNVYVAGYEKDGSGRTIAKYWTLKGKDVVKYDLDATGSGDSAGSSIVVVGGNTVYVSGWRWNGSRRVSTMWVNGEYSNHIQDDAGSNTSSYDLYVQDGAVKDGPPVIPIFATDVVLDKADMELPLNHPGGLLVGATVLPSNATNKSVVWHSSDPSVAEFVEDGHFRLVKEGVTVIRGIVYNGSYDPAESMFTLTVGPPLVDVTGVTLPSKTYTIGNVVGSNILELVPTVLPANATNKNVAWESSNINVAVVESVNGKGVVTAANPGTARITVSTNDKGKTDYTDVTVQTSVVSVSLNKSIVNLGTSAGENIEQLTAEVLPLAASNKNIIWSIVGDQTIARVNDGLVTGLKAGGPVVVRATTADQEKIADCAVYVWSGSYVPVTDIHVDPISAVVGTGSFGTNVQAYAASIVPSNASNKQVSWATSSPAIATVSGNGLTAEARGVGVGNAVISVTSADGLKTANSALAVVAGEHYRVTGVTLNKTSAALNSMDASEKTVQLVATVAPSNAANKDVVWSSSNSQVATVSSSGFVTAVNPGSAVITAATVDQGKTATCAVSVTAPTISITSLSLTKGSTYLTVGSKETLYAVIHPNNATLNSIQWYSSAPNVVSVEQNGEVTGVSVGTATISVTDSGTGLVAQCKATVSASAVSVSDVYIYKGSTTIGVGGYEFLFADIVPGNATNQNVVWSSSNAAVATVEQSGLVRGVSVGSAVITVKTVDGNKTAVCNVTVSSGNVAVSVVSMHKGSTTIGVGGSEVLFASVLPSNAVNQKLVWHSSAPNVAYVDGSGRVFGVSSGAATITAESVADSSKSDVCQVIVSSSYVPVSQVALQKSSTILAVGKSETLFADISPRNATNQNIAWSSSAPNVATVDLSGRATGRAVGSATITVTTLDQGKTASLSVSVVQTAVQVTGISLNKSSLTIGVGDTEALVPSLIPSNATDQGVLWQSSAPGVAYVDGAGRITGISSGVALVTAKSVSGGFASDCFVTVVTDMVHVTGISLNKATLQLTVGSSETLVPNVSPGNANNKDIVWSSSASSIASVDPKTGFVTGLSVGNATITATTVDGGKTATCGVAVGGAVVPVSGVSVSPVSVALNVGGTETLVANIVPDNATNKGVVWFSSDSTKVSVSDSGVVTGMSGGSAVVFVITSDGSKIGQCSVNVSAPAVPVSGVSVEPSSVTIVKDGGYPFVAVVSPDNASNKAVLWSSSNEAVVVVNSNGAATGVSNGKASVTATTVDGGKSATVEVTVITPAISVTGVSVNPASASIGVNGTQTFTAVVSPSDASNKIVSWSSSNPGVAFVNASGVATGLMGGSTVITATTADGSKTATANLTVVVSNVGAESVSVYPNSVSMVPLGSCQLMAEVLPSDVSNSKVIWSSSNPSVASVGIFGLVRALASGSSVITAFSADGQKSANCAVTVFPASESDWSAIAAGGSHSLSVKPNGSLWSFGKNDKGQLGLNSVVDAKVPQLVGVQGVSWSSIAAGTTHSLAITSDGQLWAWGENTYGQLGLGDKTNRLVPVRVGNDSDWLSVFAGGMHSFAIKTDGSLWGWGYNSNGQLGLGDTFERVSPVMVGSYTNWVGIGAGYGHTLGIRADGSLWSWGYNSNGQLGFGDKTNRLAPARLGADNDWIAVSAGYRHSLALRADGSIWSWGLNDKGQLGKGGITDGNVPVRIGSGTEWNIVSLGYNHSLSVKDRRASTWGLNNRGQLGLGDKVDRQVPSEVYSVSDIVAASLGDNFTLVLTADGRIYGWGENSNGQLGNGTLTDSFDPVVVNKPVTRVTLDRDFLLMEKNSQETLVGTVYPLDATNRSFVWSSSNPLVATVSQTGVVTSIVDGTTVITFTSVDGSYMAQCNVTVKAPVTGVTLDVSSFTINKGQTRTLVPTISPSNASNKNVVWVSNNYDVASVDDDGVVTAVGGGSAIIAVATVDGNFTATCNVTVNVPVSSVDIDVPAVVPVVLNKDATYQIQYQVNPADASNPNVTWSTSSSSIATVSATGLVTGKAVGNATITVTTADGAKTDSLAFKVVIPVTGVTLNSASGTINKGNTVTLTATVAPSNATDKTVVWVSSDEAIATVDSNGKVTGVANGSTTITVVTNDSGKMANYTVTVNVPVTGVTLDSTSFTVNNGDSRTLVATVAPSDASNSNVNWTTSNASIATVSNGVVTGVGKGTATITATSAADTSKKATCSVTVNVPVTGISLNYESDILDNGKTRQLTATLVPASPSNSTVTWSTSDSAVATVSTAGLVTGRGNGSCVITATTADGGFIATCSFVVVTPVSSVTLSGNISMPVLAKRQMTVVVAPANATIKAVTWSSNKPSVATVDSLGMVTAVSAGSATITATSVSGAKTATATVTVNAVSQSAWSKVAAGYNFAVGLKPDGSLWSWGNNVYGQLGHGNNANIDSAKRIGLDSDWKDVSAGFYHVLALKSDGTLWSWGRNDSGQVGDGYNANINIPILIGPYNDWVSVFAGNNNSFGIRSDGSLWAWGHRHVSGPGGETWVPRRLGADNDWASVGHLTNAAIGVKNDGSLWVWGNEPNSVGIGSDSVDFGAVPQRVGNGNDWSAAFFGNNGFFHALKNDGTLWAWGRNDYGQLGLGNNADNYVVTQVGTSADWVGISSHKLFAGGIHKTGKMYSWGYNNKGQLGIGSTADKNVPTQIGTATNWMSVSLGGDFGLALDNIGKLYSWGNNDYGQLNKPGTGPSSPGAANIPLVGISLNKTSTTIGKGNTETLSVTFAPTDATVKTLAWSSTDPNVASVNGSGVVTGLTLGETVVTATSDDGSYVVGCVVTIIDIPVTGVSVSPTSASIYKGNTRTLTATVTPSNALNKIVSWSSSNTSVATVNSSGVVSAVGNGSATITVKTDDGNYTATCTVTVTTKIAVTGVSISPTSLTVNEGTNLIPLLTYTITPSNADADGIPVWSGSDSSVIHISNGSMGGYSAIVESVYSGTATLTLEVDGKKATCAVTVVDPHPVTGISVPSTKTVNEGDRFVLSATITPSNATHKDVTWACPANGINVDFLTGEVYAWCRGSYLVTATSWNGKTATCLITVI